MPTVGDKHLARELDDMAKGLMQLSNTHIKAATRLAMNQTLTSTRQLASKNTASKYKVQESRVKSIVPIKPVRSYNRLVATITVVEVPIPLIDLITNSKGKNKGKIKRSGFKANRVSKKKRGKLRAVAQLNIKIGGQKIRRSLGRAFIAANERGKVHVLARLSPDKESTARPYRKKGSKKGRVFVPKIPIHEQLIKDVPNILMIKRSTTYLRILQHEYKRRLDGTIKSSKRN